MSDPDPPAGAVSSQEQRSTSTASPRRRRSRAIPIAVLLLAAAPLAWQAPIERTVTLHLEHPSSITGLEFTWLDDDGAALSGSHHNFAARVTPLSVRFTDQLTPGAHQLRVRIDRYDKSVEQVHSLDFGLFEREKALTAR